MIGSKDKEHGPRLVKRPAVKTKNMVSGPGLLSLAQAASSIRSIALSGRNLSLIYLSLKLAAATRALSEILTL